jgi:uncharacterized protein DUF3592
MKLDAATINGINGAVGVVGLAVGVAILLSGGYWIHHNHLDEFLAKPPVADGQVVENQRVGNYRHGYRVGTSYLAIVKFTGHSGQTVLHRDWVSSNPPAFFVGQSVKIFYDPQDSQAAMIDRGAKNYYLPVFLGMFGGLAALGSVQRLRMART